MVVEILRGGIEVLIGTSMMRFFRFSDILPRSCHQELLEHNAQQQRHPWDLRRKTHARRIVARVGYR